MAKDILLYGSIWEYNVMYFFEQISEALEEDGEAELTLRINSEGGNPDYGTSIIEKIQELSDQMYVKVGGMAHSMAFFILVYIDAARVECIDSTKAIVHRAAYSSWLEGQPNFKGSMYEQILVKMNKDLEKAFRARINVEDFESLPQMKERNLKVKDIFSLESREEVLLTAADLKKLKLVGKINKLTPSKEGQAKAQIEAFNKCRTIEEFRMAAQIGKPSAEETHEPEKNTYMTQEEIKTKFPAVYAAIVAEGKTEGVAAGIKAEKERVAAWLPWESVDKVAVAKAISDGSTISMVEISAFSAKAANAKALTDVAEDSPKTEGSAKPEAEKKEEDDKKKGVKTEAEKKKEEFLAAARAERKGEAVN